MTSTDNDENRLPRARGKAIDSKPVNPYMRRKMDQTSSLGDTKKVDTVDHISHGNSIVSEPHQACGNGAGDPIDDNGVATSKLEQRPLELLLRLQRDYEAPKKNSVRACLRSKAFPCPEVSDVLEHYADLDLLKLEASYQTLVEHEEYLGPILEQNIKFQSTLWCMTRLGTAFRFLQLLVVSKNLESHATARMISELLKKLNLRIEAGFNIEYLSPEEGEDDKEEQEDDDLYSGQIRQQYYPPQIACFALAFLMKIRAKILSLRPSLLPPFWRSIDATAVWLSPKVPSQFLQDGIEGLSDVLKGFLQVSLTGLGQFQQQGGTNSHALPIHHQQFKMMSFILSRLESFLRISASSNEDLDKEIVEKTLGILLCFRGLPSIWETGPMAEHLQNLALKAAKCFSPILLKECNCENDQHEVIFTPQFTNLKQLCDMTDSSGGPLPKILNHFLDPNAKRAITIGKAHALEQILQHLISPPSSRRLFMEEKNVNIVLSLCEHVLFVALPLCYDLLFRPSLRELIDKNLHCISDALYLIATTAPCMTHNSGNGPTALDQLLLRWLMMPLRNGDHHQSAAGSMQHKYHHHPLARESVISSVHFHVARLHNATAITTTTTSCGPECLSLLNLLVKALMDHRTTTYSRRTIATLIRDILLASTTSLSSQNLINALQRQVCVEYGTKRPIAKKRKRKRGRDKGSTRRVAPTKGLRTWQYFGFEDLEIISSVLAIIPFSILPNAASDVERFIMELDTSVQHRNPKRRMKRHKVNKTILSMTLLMAAAKESPATDSIHTVTSGLDISELQAKICKWFGTMSNLEYETGNMNPIASKRIHQLAALGIATIRFLVMGTEINAKSAKKATKVVDIERVRGFYKVLDTCTSDSLFNSLGESSLRQTSLEHQLVLEVAGSIDILVGTIPVAHAEEMAQGFATIFRRLFSQSCWSLHAHTVGSFWGFLQFLQHLDKRDLKKWSAKCTPKPMRQGIGALTSSRVHGKVYKYDKHKHQDNTNNCISGELYRIRTGCIMQHCSNELQGLVNPVPLSLQSTGHHRLFPIEIGSYLVEMPTQEGRKATVVFPPGESSLRDIRYMLDPGGISQDEENQHLQPICKLQALRPVQDGSYVALLRSVEE